MTQVTPANLPYPPAEYDQEYIAKLVSTIEALTQELNARKRVYATTINVNNLPTSATGLRAGDFWNDSGDVKVAT